jgi:DNA-binding response OmpR family regulator
MATRELYRFGAFTLDVADRRLSHGDTAVQVSPKAYDVLVVLVRYAGRLVTKDDWLARVWPDAFVEEGILKVHISEFAQGTWRPRRQSGLHPDDSAIRLPLRGIGRDRRRSQRRNEQRAFAVPESVRAGRPRALGIVF